MSTLEVLQSFPSQQSGLDPIESNLIAFDTKHITPHLSHQLTFQIQVTIMEKLIHRIVVNEGETTSVMSISCWKALGSPPITPSPTILIYFDGCSFSPYGIFTSLPITVGHQKVTIEVEVNDLPLEYNLLLGRNWTYVMKVVTSTMFRTI